MAACGATHHCAHSLVVEEILQVARPVNHGAQSLAIARLAEKLMRNPDSAARGFWLCLSREHDADCAGIVLLHLLQQRGAVHARHAHVGDDDVEGLPFELGQRCRRA